MAEGGATCLGSWSVTWGAWSWGEAYRIHGLFPGSLVQRDSYASEEQTKHGQTLNSRILIIRTPKTRYPNFRKA